MLSVVGCSQEPKRRQAKPAIKSSEAKETRMESGSGSVAMKITRLLGEMPSWVESHAEQNEQITQTLREISSYEVDEVRRGVVAFVAEVDEPSFKELSKVFLLNRFYFNVPSEISLSEAEFFGGWEGVPYSAETVDLRWPFTKNPKGELVITGDFSGYNGDTYACVDEFDYFQQKFGRKKQVKVEHENRRKI